MLTLTHFFGLMRIVVRKTGALRFRASNNQAEMAGDFCFSGVEKIPPAEPVCTWRNCDTAAAE
jgi:hypothetical protein